MVIAGIGVLRDTAGQPFLGVRGTVAAAAALHGIGAWHLSLSHDAGLRIAMVVAETVLPAERVPGHDEQLEREA